MGQTDTFKFNKQPDSVQVEHQKLVYIFEIKEMIAAAIWRTTKIAFEKATEAGADLVIIDMNTYGGEVASADSIRTHILNSKIPVYVFINDNAASAGALISIACDSIYMKPGAKIGAATVVNQSGEQVPDKYQSYMRATMRATAEAHGKDTIIKGTDTTYVWVRDPHIAEAMVDPRMYVENISDTGQVLTFTATEAMANGYCEGIVENRNDLLEKTGFEDAKVVEYKAKGIDKVISFLLSPYIAGILIMIIIGGIYFELQSPGIGFPLIASILAALLYFAPQYLEGMAEYWEFLLFGAGIILILVEIFAIPGFGITGVAGVIAMVLGLTLSLVDNDLLKDFEFTGEGMNLLVRALGTVVLASFLGLVVSIWAASKLLTTSFLGNLALKTDQKVEQGYVSFDTSQKNLVGKEGTAYTVLRPSGKVQVEGEVYDAKSEFGFIDKGAPIKVIRFETGQIYVTKA